MASIDSTYLIVGGGMVADSAARGIRELDPDGTIAIIAAEDDPPATRPALSKLLWTDPDFGFEKVWLNTEDDTGAVRHAGEAAVSIDPAAKTVTTDAGTTYGYEKLLLATGGRPTRLDTPESDRILYYRSVADYRRLRELAGDGAEIVVVGGSYIGTEIAAALVQNDTRTTLVHSEDTLGGSIFPEGLAQHFEDLFAKAGVTLVAGARMAGASVDGERVAVALDDGMTLEADAAVIGLGVTPAIDYLDGSGLATASDDEGGGVEVDERLQTSDPAIWAAGDIARYPDAILGRRRVEHVDNANEMGARVGRNLAGADEVYDHTPYYYSAVFGNRYEAVGALDSSLDTVEDWQEPFEKGVVYYVDGDRVAGVLLWNVEGARDAARAVIRDATDVTPEALRGSIPFESPAA